MRCRVLGLAWAWLPLAIGAAKKVEVTGVLGSAHKDASLINGVYTASSLQSNGHPCFTRTDGRDMWLCMDDSLYWAMQPQSQIGLRKSLMISSKANITNPQDVLGWMLWEGGVGKSAGGWQVFPKIHVRAYTPSDKAAKESAVTWTIAVMLFGALVVGMSLVSLVNAQDPNVRSYMYKMVSTTLTIFMAVILNSALWAILFEQVLPAEPPRGLGLGKPIEPAIKISLSFALFTIGWGLLTFFGWKVQFSHPRLCVLKTLGAHLTAFIAMFSFHEIQREVVKLGGTFGKGGMYPDLMAFAAVVGAWLVFGVYQAASKGARIDAFRNPPNFPWARPVSQTLQTATRTCGWMGTQSPQALQQVRKEVLPDWEGEIDESEDEAAVCVMAFLLNQAVIYACSHELPGLGTATAYSLPAGQSAANFWYIVTGVFLVLYLLVFLIRVKCVSKDRSGRLLQRILAMSVSWSLYRLVTWESKDLFPENEAMANVICAFAISTASVVFMIMLDKVADRLHSALPGAKDAALAEGATRNIIGCFGLLVGLSWDKAFESALETIVEGTPTLSQHVVISKVSLSVVLVLLVVRPWRKYILPKAEMSEEAHHQSIQQELLSLERAEGSLAFGQ